MKVKTDRKVIDVDRKECFPTDHNFVSVTGAFYAGAQTLAGTSPFSHSKVFCTKCGKILPL